MRRVCFAAAAAAVLACAPAAAAPLISGKYIVAEHRMCQAKEVFHFANGGALGNYVDQVNLQGGEVGNTLVLATFNATKGTASISGFDGTGDPVLVQLTGAQNTSLGNTLSEKPVSQTKVPYTNDDTTFTFGGTVYHVLYGQVDKNNIAHYAVFQGISQNDVGASCTEQGTVTRQ